MAMQVFLKKKEKYQINNLTLHIKQLEKEEIKNPKVSRKEEVLKIRVKKVKKKQSRLLQKSTKLQAGLWDDK